MTQPPMAHEARGVLARAAADGLARSIELGSDRAVLAYIIDQIATCVLARCLTIRVAQNHLTCEAAGRALLRITGITAPNTPKPQPLNVALGPDDITSIAPLFQTLAGQGGTVSLTSTPLTHEQDPHKTGIPAHDIAAHFGLTPERNAQCPLTRLLDHAANDVIAHRAATNDWQVNRPDTPNLQPLLTLADRVLTNPTQHPFFTPDTLLVLTPDRHLSITLVTTKDGPAALILNKDAATRLTNIWPTP